VAYSDGKLFRGTGDAHVLATDAADCVVTSVASMLANEAIMSF
jgi:hypothetical protein